MTPNRYIKLEGKKMQGEDQSPVLEKGRENIWRLIDSSSGGRKEKSRRGDHLRTYHNYSPLSVPKNIQTGGTG